MRRRSLPTQFVRLQWPMSVIAEFAIIGLAPQLAQKELPWPLPKLGRYEHAECVRHYCKQLLRDFGLSESEVARVLARTNSPLRSPLLRCSPIAPNAASRPPPSTTSERDGEPLPPQTETFRHYILTLNLAADPEPATRAFREWYIAEKQRASLCFCHRRLCRLTLFRDLLVLKLSEYPEWDSHRIELQFAYMHLPSLCRSTRTDADAMRRKICFRLRKLLRDVQSLQRPNLINED